MKRREFIKSTALAGAGLAIGLPDVLLNELSSPLAAKGPALPRTGINYPHGGCTESSIASFDRGPFGGNPFGFYS